MDLNDVYNNLPPEKQKELTSEIAQNLKFSKVYFTDVTSLSDFFYRLEKRIRFHEQKKDHKSWNKKLMALRELIPGLLSGKVKLKMGEHEYKFDTLVAFILNR